MKQILFISNGKGEDSIALTIIGRLRKIFEEQEEEFTIKALPLIGNGTAYKNDNIQVLNTWPELKNGGFFTLSELIQQLSFGDLRSRYRSQRDFIQKISPDYDLLLCVGDFYPVFLAAFYTKNKIVHLATAMTNYIRGYNFIEKFVFRKRVSLVINRDEPTATDLLASGVRAAFYGNPMLDDDNLKLKRNTEIGLEFKKKNILLIPSSRDDAYQNFQEMAQLIEKFGELNNFVFYMSLHPALQLRRFVAWMKLIDWDLTEQNKQNVLGYFSKPGANKIYIIDGNFRQLLDNSTAAIGMTGTGNEQVVGLGVPLILLRGKSRSSSLSRLRHYRKLLGGAIFIAPFFNKEEKILEVLNSTSQLNKMKDIGQERFGENGGSYQIARKIYEVLMQ